MGTWCSFVVVVLLIAFGFLTNFVQPLPAPSPGPGPGDSDDFFDKIFKGFSSSSSSSEETKSFWDNKNRNEDFFDENNQNQMNTFIQVVIGIIIFVIVLTCATFVICCVCPICIIAKKRKRRGVVIRVNQEVTRNGNGRQQQQQQQQQLRQTQNVIPPQTLIAVSNNSRNTPSPYPVQESVTIVPLIHTTNAQPQQPHQGYNNYPAGGHHQNTSPYNYDAPPPYFEIEQQRHVSSSTAVISEVVQQPYNPYYREEDHFVPSAPTK